MSRIGRKIINIPEGTDISFEKDILTISGPKGSISKPFKDVVSINIDKDSKSVSLSAKEQSQSALWGTYGSIISNMIEGVNNLFSKKLILEGIGYKSEVKADKIIFALGFSHPVSIEIPKGLSVTAEKNIITISGVDKEAVGLFASRLRLNKKPEPYKGKGMRYDGEVIKRKQGKKSA